MSAPLGDNAPDEIAQIRQWYADPVRELPRKVVGDVARLLAILDREVRARVEITEAMVAKVHEVATRDAEIARLRAERVHEYIEHCKSCAVVEARVAQLEAALQDMREYLKGKHDGSVILPLRDRICVALAGDQ